MRALLLLLVLVTACSPVDPVDLWVEGVMETDCVLGSWKGLVQGDQVQIGGVTYSTVDTVHWVFRKEGVRRNDTLFYVREYHPSGKTYDASKHGYEEGRVGYVRGDGTSELDYGLLRFRMPARDSLWVKTGNSNWEKLRRR